MSAVPMKVEYLNNQRRADPMFASKAFVMGPFATTPIPDLVPWFYDAATLQEASAMTLPWSLHVPFLLSLIR